MEPDYIYDFKHVPDVDVKAKLRSLKKHGYNRKAEDEQLKGIVKNIKIQRGDQVQRRLRTFGSLNIEDEPEQVQSEAISECPSHIEQEYEKDAKRGRKSIMIQSKHARASEMPPAVSPELLRRQTMMNWMNHIDRKMNESKDESETSSMVDEQHLNLRMLSKTAEPGKRVQFYSNEQGQHKREDTEVPPDLPDVLTEKLDPVHIASRVRSIDDGDHPNQHFESIDLMMDNSACHSRQRQATLKTAQTLKQRKEE